MATQRMLTSNVDRFRYALRQPVAWLLITLLTFGNPLACLLHCWGHDHAPLARETGEASHAAHQAHGGGSYAVATHLIAASQMENPPQNTTAASEDAACRSIHHVPSVVTIAVLFGLLMMVVPFRPVMPIVQPRTFLRFLSLPPPLQPPRFAAFCV